MSGTFAKFVYSVGVHETRAIRTDPGLACYCVLVVKGQGTSLCSGKLHRCTPPHRDVGGRRLEDHVLSHRGDWLRQVISCVGLSLIGEGRSEDAVMLMLEGSLASFPQRVSHAVPTPFPPPPTQMQGLCRGVSVKLTGAAAVGEWQPSADGPPDGVHLIREDWLAPRT